MGTVTAMLRQLSQELPGWHVWVSTTGGRKRWNAVPAPSGTPLAEVVLMAGRVSGDGPATLLAACLERYGWYETCDNCGVPARECGHRAPEQER